MDQCTDNVNYINKALTEKKNLTHELSQDEDRDFIEAKELMKNKSMYELFKLASDAKKYTDYLEEILNEYPNDTIQDLESLKKNFYSIAKIIQLVFRSGSKYSYSLEQLLDDIPYIIEIKDSIKDHVIERLPSPSVNDIQKVKREYSLDLPLKKSTAVVLDANQQKTDDDVQKVKREYGLDLPLKKSTAVVIDANQQKTDNQEQIQENQSVPSIKNDEDPQKDISLKDFEFEYFQSLKRLTKEKDFFDGFIQFLGKQEISLEEFKKNLYYAKNPLNFSDWINTAKAYRDEKFSLNGNLATELPKLLEMQKILQSFSITKNEELKHVLENLTKINALKEEKLNLKKKNFEIERDGSKNSPDGQNEKNFEIERDGSKNSPDGQNDSKKKKRAINTLLDNLRFIKSPEQGIVSEETANQEPSTDNQETKNLTSAISDDTQDTSSNQSFIQNDSKPKNTVERTIKDVNQAINKEVEEARITTDGQTTKSMIKAYDEDYDKTGKLIKTDFAAQQKSLQERLQRRKKKEKEGKNSEISTAVNSEISTADSAQSANSQNQQQAVQSSEVSVQEPSTEEDLHKAPTNTEEKMSAELPTPNNIQEEQTQTHDSQTYDSVILKQKDYKDYNKTNEVTDGSPLNSSKLLSQTDQTLNNVALREGFNEADLQNQAPQTQLADLAQSATFSSVNPQNQQQDSLPKNPLASIPETSVILTQISDLEENAKISKINEYIALINSECKQIENEMEQIRKKLTALTKNTDTKNNTESGPQRNQLNNKAEKLKKFAAQRQELEKEIRNIREARRKSKISDTSESKTKIKKISPNKTTFKKSL
ncbi:hypothetical protein HE1_00986 [Holospora elegans E1]|uniref:Uncharacterized protein n=1 Tax=Holospora elegans E1 TaxID=1427503 RepID=A0A023DZU2_9PROT|nr:hypothetical protein [Holospora elegans]GAJ46648.1 hypothetical protein HE1_00986 [Holospora elegans E1]